MSIVCEVSFEVCNKVGGIYTVVSSKVPILQSQVSRYIAIGPWFDNSHNDFIQCPVQDVPKDIQRVFDILYSKGIYCTYGYWDIPGKPETVLLNFTSLLSENALNDLKKKYWDYFSVDSLDTEFEFNEPLAFSTAAGMFIEELSNQNDALVIAQLHEWMSGFAGLYLKARIKEHVNNSVKTVFTTHATMLGRALSSSGVKVDQLQKSFNADAEAKKIGVLSKHSTEKACAKYLDAFTTVSAITAKEANLFFGVKPLQTYNGLDLDQFTSGKELVIKQFNARNELEHLAKWKFPEINFEPYLFIYTSGRPEFHNKGFDSIISSLKLLQDKGVKVVCFFFVPWNHHSLKEPSLDISTHYLDNEFSHDIVSACNKEGVDNSGSVKVILYPPYLGSQADTFFSGSYYDTISGCDLGIFPSSYEPWGYTPMESCAVGVPAITSDETGFGDFCKKKRMKGITIIKKDESEVQNLFLKIVECSNYSSDSKLDCMILAQDVAKKCDWKVFVKNYLNIYNRFV